MKFNFPHFDDVNEVAEGGGMRCGRVKMEIVWREENGGK